MAPKFYLTRNFISLTKLHRTAKTKLVHKKTWPSREHVQFPVRKISCATNSQYEIWQKLSLQNMAEEWSAVAQVGSTLRSRGTGLSLTNGTELFTWARHFILCIVLVQTNNCSDMTEKLLDGT